MAAIASSDVTITPQASMGLSKGRIEGGKRKVLVKIAFGDGALTYPSGGVPMPAKENFGMLRNLDYLLISDNDDAQGIVWKWDYENKKLRGYILGVHVAAAGAGTLDDFPIDTTAEPLAEAASVGAVGLEAAMNLLGRMAELKTASAPAATVLYAEAVGY